MRIETATHCGRLCSPLLLAVLIFLAGCAAPGPLDAAFGWTDDVGDLHPDIALEASPVLADDRMGIEVRVAAPRGEMLRLGADTMAATSLTLHVRIRISRQGPPLAETTAQVGRAARDAYSYGSVVIPDLPPGRVTVEASLLVDEMPLLVRQLAVTVPAPTAGATLTPLRLSNGEGRAGIRLPAWETGERLRAVTDVVNPPADAVLEFRVLRLAAYAGAAEPPYWAPPAPAALAFRGVDLDPALADTVAVERRYLDGAAPSTLGAEVPPLVPGPYLLTATLASDGVSLDVQHRPLSVLPAGHPAADDLDTRIGAIGYIAYPAELEPLEGVLLESERASRLDHFWATLIPDTGRAEVARRRYYERVSTANRLFASHLPGWMTDRGMVYVVLGPPDHVERTAEAETWHYGERDASAYVFERVEGSPFGQYVLRRAARYQAEWRQAVDRWRRGD